VLVGRVAPSAAATINADAGVTDGAPGSLRAAFDAVNANAEADEIVLQAGQVYEITLCGAAGQENDNLDGDLDHTAAESLAIRGNGATIRNTCPDERVLDGGIGDVPGPLVLDRVTITGGLSDGGGGAVRSYGPLTVTKSVLSGNRAADSGGAVDAKDASNFVDTVISGNLSGSSGGAVYADDPVFLRCTLSDNEALEGGAVYTFAGVTFTECTVNGNRAPFAGGAITSLGDPIHELRITNSTFSGNDSSPDEGGAIRTYAPARIRSSTFVGNVAGPGLGAIYALPGSVVQFASSIVAGNTGGDCVVSGGSFDSAGNNIDSDASCGLFEGGDRPGTDPQLGQLADNGGPTLTHLPGPGSPALDGGNAMDCPATDQRGQMRPTDGNGDGVASCDIGAVELLDLCPTDPAKTTAGVCGCGVADSDVDQPNGTADCLVNGELKARVARARAIVAVLAGSEDPLGAELSTIGESLPAYAKQRKPELQLANPKAKLAKLAKKARKALGKFVRAKAGAKLEKARTRATTALDRLDAAVASQT
jgi:predicted outer membrane repeat protein